jgi:tetratricopeptide (TPR) repeat protein
MGIEDFAFWIAVASATAQVFASFFTFASWLASPERRLRLQDSAVGRFGAKAGGFIKERSNLLWTALIISISVWLMLNSLERHEHLSFLMMEIQDEYGQGRYERTREKLMEASLLAPEHYYILKKLGDCERNLRNYVKAEELYRAAVKQRSGYRKAYVGLVEALYHQSGISKIDEAIEVYKSHLDDVGADGEEFYVGGLAYSHKWVGLGKFEEDEHFRKANELYENCQKKPGTWTPWCYYNQACLQSLLLKNSDVKADDSIYKKTVEKGKDLLCASLERASVENRELLVEIPNSFEEDDTLLELRLALKPDGEEKTLRELCQENSEE